MKIQRDPFITTIKKALTINQDQKRYGTFAEIGAGQEVARHFFRAGLASHTIAKTMSAYDMVFSDAIYGTDDRYVSKSRLHKMLDHEYDLLTQRLGEKRGKDSLFFVFANTVTTHTARKNRTCHGWMGVRFQMKPKGTPNDVIIHIKMKDFSRLQQQEALGILGVNILFSAFYLHESESQFVTSLVENLGVQRVEIDIIHSKGPDLTPLDEMRLNFELLSQKISEGVLFNPDNLITQTSEVFHNTPLLVQRGTFRPITNVNVDIIQKGCEQFQQDYQSPPPQVLMVLSIDENSNHMDYLRRVEIINSLGYHALLSNFKMFYELKSYLRHATQNQIVMVIGASHLKTLFDEDTYQDVAGKLLTAFGNFFDDHTRIYVFPYKSKKQCQTIRTFHPKKEVASLYQYLIENEMLKDISNCEEVDTSFHSQQVRQMLVSNNSAWENLIPKNAVKLIKKHQLFGYKA